MDQFVRLLKNLGKCGAHAPGSPVERLLNNYVRFIL